MIRLTPDFDKLQRLALKCKVLDDYSKGQILVAILALWLTPAFILAALGYWLITFIGTLIGFIIGLSIFPYFVFKILFHGCGFANSPSQYTSKIKK
jgi:hypothetical protein